jgi:hypothetical protein
MPKPHSSPATLPSRHPEDKRLSSASPATTPTTTHNTGSAAQQLKNIHLGTP